jgi:hypothetical protein
MCVSVNHGPVLLLLLLPLLLSERKREREREREVFQASILYALVRMAQTKNLGDVKVGELPSFLRQNVTSQAASSWYWRWLDGYRQKHFSKNARIAPLFHVMLLVGGIGYALHYPHLRK